MKTNKILFLLFLNLFNSEINSLNLNKNNSLKLLSFIGISYFVYLKYQQLKKGNIFQITFNDDTYYSSGSALDVLKLHQGRIAFKHLYDNTWIFIFPTFFTLKELAQKLRNYKINFNNIKFTNVNLAECSGVPGLLLVRLNKDQNKNLISIQDNIYEELNPYKNTPDKSIYFENKKHEKEPKKNKH